MNITQYDMARTTLGRCIEQAVLSSKLVLLKDWINAVVESSDQT